MNLKLMVEVNNQSIFTTNALTEANNYKPLNEWSKNDASAFILHIQGKKSRFNKNYKVGTIEQFKLMVRKYFRWAGKPEIVAHLKVKLPKNNLSRDDILTVEDVNKLIETTMSPMYKAYIATLFESGII